MNLNPDHLSASRIKTYLMCAMKYRLTYVDRVPWAFKPAALVLGTAVHAAVEAYYRARTDRQDLTVDDLKDVFDQAWNDEVAQDLPLDTDSPDNVKDQGHALLQVFTDHAVPQHILAVEDSFRVPLIDPDTGELLDIDLVGRLDLVETDGAVVPGDPDFSMETPPNRSSPAEGTPTTRSSPSAGTPVIVDLKTLGRKPSETDLLYDLQLSAYAFAARQTGLVPHNENVLLRLDVLTKTKTPAFSQHFAVRTPDSDRRFVALASDVLHAIRSGAFPPNPGWQCAGCPLAVACTAMP